MTIPTEGYKTYAGAALMLAAALGLWTKLATFEQATALFMTGMGLAGIGLRAAQGRQEKQLEANTEATETAAAMSAVAAVGAAGSPEAAVIAAGTVRDEIESAAAGMKR